MKDNKVLVLGSKPNSRHPCLDPIAIYAANGAASLARPYRKDFSIPLTVIVGSGAILQMHDQDRVISSMPNKVIARRDRCNLDEVLRPHLPEAELKNVSPYDQWEFQKKMLGVRILIAETFYERSFRGKIGRLKRHFSVEPGLGLSTGLFAALYALYEWPAHDVILSGIGLNSGGHFYEHEGKQHGNRSRVDSWMLPRFPIELRRRLWTTDKETSESSGIKYWKV